MHARRIAGPFSVFLLGFFAAASFRPAAAQSLPELRLSAASSKIPFSDNTYGTGPESLLRVGPMQFRPADSSLTYACGGPSSFTCHPTSAANPTFAASPALPSGARVSGVDFGVCDSSAASEVRGIVYSVDHLGQNQQTLNFATTSGAPGCADLFVDISSSNFVVDNAGNQLVLVILPFAGDASQSFSGAAVHYRLQVSPAPATATFLDVPTSSPQFRFIEALAAAGITAGCGGGNYCPNDPITRGQMAVFLSTALGLQWP